MTDNQQIEPEDARARQRTPYGFLVVVIVTALYLLWRLIQGVGWVFDRLGG